MNPHWKASLKKEKRLKCAWLSTVQRTLDAASKYQPFQIGMEPWLPNGGDLTRDLFKKHHYKALVFVPATFV